MSEHDERMQAYIEETVAKFPPLTPAQVDRVAQLLRPAAEKLRREAVEQHQTPDEEHTA